MCVSGGACECNWASFVCVWGEVFQCPVLRVLKCARVMRARVCVCVRVCTPLHQTYSQLEANAPAEYQDWESFSCGPELNRSAFVVNPQSVATVSGCHVDDSGSAHQ